MATGSRQARGYDAAYDAEHRAWERRIASGERVLCWRCLVEDGVETVISPDVPWDLGHDDADRDVVRGPECRGPNRATAGRRAPALRAPEVHPALRDA